MKTKGLTLVDGVVAAAVVLVVSTPMMLGVFDTRRRVRDTELVSRVRQAQAALEIHRARTGSYPENPTILRFDEAELLEAFEYAAEPASCGSARASPCTEYRLRFALEGSLGVLAGGICTARKTGLSCP